MTSESPPLVEPAAGLAPTPHVGEGPWRAGWRRLRRQRTAMAALFALSLITGMCVVGSFLYQDSQRIQDLSAVLQAPNSQHWMGTDNLGRDLFQRVLCGGGISLLVGIVATAVATAIGVAYGLISGLAGNRLDNVMMRIVDILYGFPLIAFVILLTVVLGRSFTLLFVAIGAIEWLTVARVVRGQTLALKNQEFVLAARACGARTWRILWRHMVPNILGQVIIYATLTIPGIMLLEAVLSFLGLGVQPPNSSWGALIQEGAGNMETSSWLLIFPGAFFIATLLCLNVLGDALRDALDPKSMQNE